MSEITMSKSAPSSLRLAASTLLATSTRWPSLRKVISSSSQMDFSSSTTRICTISRPASFGALFVACIRPSLHQRKFNHELRALVFLADHRNPPAMRLHDLVNDRQPQPRAPLKIGLQRLKYLGALLRVQANAGVPEGDAQPIRNPLHPHGQGSALGHGAQRVVAEVPEHLLDLVRIHLHFARLPVERPLD